MSGSQVRVGGVWLASLAPVGHLSWTTKGAGSPWDASWSMALPMTYDHRVLRQNQVVEIMVGPERVWYGLLSEPEPSPEGWSFQARGMVREKFLALGATGASTSVPNTAVDEAISRGAHWTRPLSLSASAFKAGGGSDSLNTVDALLDAWADEAGKRWGVNAHGQVVAQVDPTVPKWHVMPGAGSMGVADDTYASELYGRYIDGSGNYQTAHVSDAAATTRWGRVEYPVDLTGLGQIDSTRATAALNGLLAKGKARPGWSQGVTVSCGALLAAGGPTADPRFVKAQDMVRLHGIVDRTRAASLTTDFVIGETRWSERDRELQILPVDKADRTLSEVLTVKPAGWKA